VREAESERIRVMAQAKTSVLAIFLAGGAGGGSGVVVTADGYALTNFHVVGGHAGRPAPAAGASALKCGMADGNLYDAVVVGLDPTGDLALVKLFGRDDFPHAEMGDSDQLQVGDWVFAMGNPFLLATDFQPTVTYGIISGVHRYQHAADTLLEYTDCLQTDASINPGNSGGPLFDAQGRLVGINGRASFQKRGRVNVGAAYAISINQAKNFMGGLRGGRIVDHATLGAVAGTDDEGRVVVTDILEQSDAYRRGLRYGDELVSFAGRAIESPNAFKNVLGTLPKGWRVPLSFRRAGERRDVLVRLAGVHTEGELLEKLGQRGPDPLPLPEPDGKPKRGAPQPGQKPRDPPAPDEQAPPLPGGDARRPPPRSPPPPAVVREHFQARRGYANYYYNQLLRDRVWKGWVEAGDLHHRGGWSIGGPLPRGGRYQFEIGDTQVRLRLPAGQSVWTATDELGSSLSPPGSGGLLPALYLLRRLAVEGPAGFGEVYYVGTAPLAGRAGLVDEVAGIQGGVEARWFFDPAKGRLLAMEFSADENADPCEVYFEDFQETGGRAWPRRMDVRHGDDLFQSFVIDRFGAGGEATRP
jgi:S1-C subfamily serine protease